MEVSSVTRCARTVVAFGCTALHMSQAAELDADPSIPFDCAQLLVLLLPPSEEARKIQEDSLDNLEGTLKDVPTCLTFV